MSVQTLYIPHTAGTVLGSHYPPAVGRRQRRPRRRHAVAGPARVHRPGRSVRLARARARGHVPVARLRRRPHRRRHLAGPARTAPACGMDYRGPGRPAPPGRAGRRRQPRPATSSVLNALYAGVHEHALHRWESSRRACDRPGPGRRPRPHGVAAHLPDRLPRRRPGPGRAGRPRRPAAAVRPGPAPGPRRRDRRRAGRPDPHRRRPAPTPACRCPPRPRSSSTPPPRRPATTRPGGWRHAVDRVWATALVTAAADGLITAATALTNAWNTRHRRRRAGHAQPGRRSAVASPHARRHHQAVIGEWLQVCRPPPHQARHRPPRAPTRS